MENLDLTLCVFPVIILIKMQDFGATVHAKHAGEVKKSHCFQTLNFLFHPAPFLGGGTPCYRKLSLLCTKVNQFITLNFVQLD